MAVVKLTVPPLARTVRLAFISVAIFAYISVMQFAFGISGLLYTGFNLAPFPALAQVAPMEVYTDNFVSPWSEGGWDVSYNLANTEQVYNGTFSVKITGTAFGAFQPNTWDAPQNLTSSYNLNFAVYSATGGSIFEMIYLGDSLDGFYSCPIPTLTANQWNVVSIPLSSCGLTSTPIPVTAISFQNNYQSQIYWLDNIRFVITASDTTVPTVSITAPPVAQPFLTPSPSPPPLPTTSASPACSSSLTEPTLAVKTPPPHMPSPGIPLVLPTVLIS